MLNPAANKSTFVAIGFFHTGNYGKVDSSGRSFFTGRIRVKGSRHAKYRKRYIGSWARLVPKDTRVFL